MRSQSPSGPDRRPGELGIRPPARRRRGSGGVPCRSPRGLGCGPGWGQGRGRHRGRGRARARQGRRRRAIEVAHEHLVRGQPYGQPLARMQHDCRFGQGPSPPTPRPCAVAHPGVPRRPSRPARIPSLARARRRARHRTASARLCAERPGRALHPRRASPRALGIDNWRRGPVLRPGGRACFHRRIGWRAAPAPRLGNSPRPASPPGSSRRSGACFPGATARRAMPPGPARPRPRR